MNIRNLIVAFILTPVSLFAKEKKNVLFIAVDDLKPILGCYGNSFIKTPNIDRLGKRGVVFTNNHCQQAVCAPSRSSLLCGLKPNHTKVWDLKTKIRDMNPNAVTIPQYFKSKGYFVTGTGKIFDTRSVDRKHDAISWSEPYSFLGDEKFMSKEYGAPALRHYQLAATKREVAKYQRIAKEKGLRGAQINKFIQEHIKPSVECVDVPDNAYVDGVIGLTGVERIKQASKKQQPFFVAVGFKRPHLPFVAPKKYWDLYQREKIPVAQYQKYAKRGPKLSYHTSGEIHSYSDIPRLETFSDIKQNIFDIDKQKELIHGYYASISYVDEQIGKLLDTIDSLGLNKNTIIVLWGDHGWHLGDHGLWCKHSNFEQATRSPLIISDSSRKTGIYQYPTEFLSVFPTVCDLAGISKPSFIEGVSLKPAMDNLNRRVLDCAVSQYGRGKREGYAFRTDRYRLVVWFNKMAHHPENYSRDLIYTEELYDYDVDPLETINVVDDPSYDVVRKRLETYCFNYFEQISEREE
ncbi:sulfatase [Halosquirtibacter xylanolyticus]|uniref:sulfatase n=1 Tax=Halosquirtibacter xylanolyticus TaxID=3374599 RepID=UPI0037496599|nr:sulfatase [Prolixibacteraceae bacterium]